MEDEKSKEDTEDWKVYETLNKTHLEVIIILFF